MQKRVGMNGFLRDHMSELSYRSIPSELLEALLDNPHESQIVVDAQGIVRYMSKSDEAFYQVSRGEAIGRNILELNPDSELLRVLETGRAEIGRIFRLRVELNELLERDGSLGKLV